MQHRPPALPAPVLADRRLRQRTARADGRDRELAVRLGLRRQRRLEVALRDHPLGEVVEPLEVRPARDREVAPVPERLEHQLRGLPVPHSSAPLPLEGAGRERPFVADPLQHRLDEVGVVLKGLRVPAPVPFAGHHAPEVGVELDRDQRRLVRPVLEDPARREQPGDGVARIGADPCAQRQPVRPLDGGDRVELHGRQPPDRRLDLGGGCAARPLREPLLRDDVPAQRPQGDGHSTSSAPTHRARLRTGSSIGTGPSSQCTDRMRSTPSLRSRSGSIRPTSRSPCSTGRT